jgi:hypothetical protein
VLRKRIFIQLIFRWSQVRVLWNDLAIIVRLFIPPFLRLFSKYLRTKSDSTTKPEMVQSKPSLTVCPKVWPHNKLSQQASDFHNLMSVSASTLLFFAGIPGTSCGDWSDKRETSIPSSSIFGCLVSAYACICFLATVDNFPIHLRRLQNNALRTM